MAESTVIIGGDEPLFGAVFGVEDQEFISNDSGRRFYVATMKSAAFQSDAGIGVDILLDDWDRSVAKSGSGVEMFYGDVRFRAAGGDTRQLARSWSDALGLPYRLPDRPMGKLMVEAVAFEHDPAEMAEKGFKAKCWFGNETDPDACEVFLRIDSAGKRAWFGEKSADDTRHFLEWLTRLG